MKIRFTREVNAAAYVYQKGATYEVPDNEAAEYVADGDAVEVRAAPEIETAAAKPKTPRKPRPKIQRK